MASTSRDVIEPAREEAQPRPMRLKSVTRCLKLPIMRCIVEIVTSVYARIKRSSPATERTLDSAESMVADVLNMASPIVETFQKPIDDFLCPTLGYVGNILHITEDPDQEEPTSTVAVEEKVTNSEKTTQPDPKEKPLAEEKAAQKVSTKAEEKPLPEEKSTSKTGGTTEKVTLEKAS